MASGNHPDAVPASHLNALENSLQHPEQQVLKIAPAESNFMELKADQVTESVASWSLTTPSSKTIVSRGMYIKWFCEVRLTCTHAGYYEPPNFPKMFAPVCDPLAAITESCRFSINGRSDSVDSELVSKATQYFGDSRRLVRSTEPLQSVRGGSIGEIPFNEANSNYYFGNYDYYEQKVAGQDEVQRDSYRSLPCLSREEFQGFSNNMLPYKEVSMRGGANTKSYRVRTYMFTSPIPCDLFTNADNDALVNVNELQIYLKFHNNIAGRLFAWRGGFTDAPAEISANISNLAGKNQEMKILYKTVTSASESSIPNTMTTLYTSYRLQREQFTDLLPPTNGKIEYLSSVGPPNLVPTSTHVMLKNIKLPQIPQKIFLFALPTQADRDKGRAPVLADSRVFDTEFPTNASDKFKDMFERINNTVKDSADELEWFQLVLADNGADASQSVLYKWCPPLVEKLLNGEGVLQARLGDTNEWATVDLSDGTWDGLRKVMKLEIDNALLSEAERNLAEKVAEVVIQRTKIGEERFKINDARKAVFKNNLRIIYKVQDASLAANANKFSCGFGNETPTLKISDIRITLNNKQNLLMVPDKANDEYYYHMCVKNGMKLSFEEFERGCPIVIDLGDDIGARGLVTGSTGLFDCQISYTVHNTMRENAHPMSAMNRDYYGQHQLIPLNTGFTAYAMFEFITALTIQPEVAMMNIGVPIDEVAQAVNTVVDSNEVDGSGLEGGLLFGLTKKKNRNKIRRIGNQIMHHAKNAHKLVNDASDFADKVDEAAGAARGILTGRGSSGMYG